MFSPAAVLQSLFTTALGRTVPLIYQRVVRRARVEAALKGAAVENSALQAAMVDFEVVIGSRYGELTERLDRFLRELESSGIIVSLSEEAIAGRTDQLSWQPFCVLHHQVFGPDSGDPRLLYEKIRSSFAASLEVLVKDPALSLLIKSVASSISGQLDRIECMTRDVQERLVVKKQPSDHMLTLQRISKSLSGKLRDIRVETNKGAKNVLIEKIYIPSRLRPRQEFGVLKEVLAAGGSSKRSKETRSESALDDPRIGYAEFRSGFRRAVVLGDPGGGKSTLCQYLCYQLAKQFSLASQFAERRDPSFIAQSTKFPVRVVLRSFESARLKEPQLSIFDFIVRDLRSICTLPLASLEEALLFALDCGICVLAFDGLDEILNTSIRRDFISIVDSFCNEFPLCPVFVTSRQVGYEDAALPAEFEEFFLEKFSDAEVSLYVSKFLKVFGGYKENEAQALSKQFMSQTYRNANDLRQNPLMLGLMAFIFASKGDVPTNRPEIYEECSILMFEKWDQRRDIKADIPADFDMLHLFGQIASEIYGNAELEDGVSAKWIRKSTEKFFLREYEDRSKAIESSKKVSNFITGRSWVMSEFGVQKFRFTHRTFMEYFFARNLEAGCESTRDLLDAIMPHVLNREWDVISHLAVQMKTFRHARRTNEAVAHLSRMLSETFQSLEKEAAVAEFFAAALSYLTPAEIDCKNACLELIRTLFKLAEHNQIEAAVSILQLLCGCTSERKTYIRRVVSDKLVYEIKTRMSKCDKIFRFCCMAVSLDDAPFFPKRYLGSLGPGVTLATQKEVKTTLMAGARRDPFLALLYWEWFNEGFHELFAVHGFNLFTNDTREWPKNRIPIFTRLLHIINGITKLFADEPVISRTACLEILEQIGRIPDEDTVVTSITGVVSFRMILPDDVWVQAINNLGANAIALRGLLLLYVLMKIATASNFAHRKKIPAGTMNLSTLARKRERSGVDAEVVKSVAGLPRLERRLLDFWVG